MGRKRDNFSRNFYNFDTEKNVSVCKICKKHLDGNYITNLKRHLLDVHKDLYDAELQRNENKVSCEKKTKISVNLSRSEVKDACIDLVTTEKMPFAILDSSAFKVLTGQIFSGLEMSPISSKNVMTLIDEKYCKIKSDIQSTIKDKVLCLKMDTATRHNRGILGINILYYNNNNKICVKTLSLIEINKRHTANNLCLEVESILEEFQIEKSQIYCVITDNGKNMVKTVDILNGDNNFIECDTDDEIDDDEILNELTINSITSIKCAAHSLQLAVKDFFKEEEEFTPVVNKARNIVKILRTPTYR